MLNAFYSEVVSIDIDLAVQQVSRVIEFERKATWLETCPHPLIGDLEPSISLQFDHKTNSIGDHGQRRGLSFGLR
ncbi:hypothetical protein AOT93_03560 [Mycobacteroides sp. H110]|nr:hypothetical protein AOT87_04420 [Mycobacteroides sp. H003]KRQ32499.1 hypothetical protein AOT91_11435 [Mycobacteroides sp. H092]KRQ42154.1 hypothetical protein AOT88_25665 [Mycobacteroides sp. H063]KRQ54390.1 hypothetical protein AOT94_22930 [Mycobacteroides sp. HXVII]KRQ62251.1 hypothetical protein AOT90_15360 [Mycobacteroides sp. H079]KRQ79016.1 hypothetical protein AOT95_18735 [Mycobacteroides sp. HXXIII]KRQ84736.1 hypothetical protein AOT93_03560 [Mycobacteroides sp. H110]